FIAVFLRVGWPELAGVLIGIHKRNAQWTNKLLIKGAFTCTIATDEHPQLGALIHVLNLILSRASLRRLHSQTCRFAVCHPGGFLPENQDGLRLPDRQPGLLADAVQVVW